MKPWRNRNRKARRRIPRNVWRTRKINRITREFLLPAIIQESIESAQRSGNFMDKLAAMAEPTNYRGLRYPHRLDGITKA